MSLSGLNSGLYQQFYRYAELTDKTLIEIKEQSSNVQVNRQRLGNLFVELEFSRLNDISARLIWNLLIDEMKLDVEKIRFLGESLLQAKEIDQVIAFLESLALVLAQEQAVVRTNLRRGLR